ncbi:MAG: hypothetical protein GYB51_13065 [Rhodobacteraceae bacterium]|nr:hypothetical protein [Paracoccaceae bacterium]
MALTLANRLSLPAILGRAPHWLAQNAVARKALWYADFRRGQFARNGLARGFPQMGGFSSAGMRYERAASGLLVPRGVDEPRLADYSTGARRWLMEGMATNQFGSYYATTNAIVTSMPDEIGPDGATGGVNRVRLSALPSSSVQFQTAGSLTADNKVISIYIKEFGVSGTNDICLYGSKAGGNTQGPIETAISEWRRIDLDATDNTAVYLNNFDDSFASDVLVALPMVEYGFSATSPVGVNSTRAPDLFTSDFSSFDLSGGFWVFLQCLAQVKAGEDQALLRLAGSGGDFCDILSPSSAPDLLRIRQRASATTSTVQTSHTYGNGLSMAALFKENELRLVYSGTEATPDLTSPFSAPDVLYLADLDGAGSSHIVSAAYEKLWIAPASAYTVADMKALTA